MNRLVLVPSVVVVASYAALASYIAWPTIVYEHGRSRAALDTPASVENRSEIREVDNSPTEPSWGLPSYEVPNKQEVTNQKPPAAVLPETSASQSIWVTVLLPARVHTGPSVDTPISHFYAAGTPLRATHYRNDWFEIVEPGTSQSGWIYRKYLGAIGSSEQGKIASQEAETKSPVARPVSGKRYAKAPPVKRYASIRRFSKQSTWVKQVAARPIRGQTEMASLLQRAFSGY